MPRHLRSAPHALNRPDVSWWSASALAGGLAVLLIGVLSRSLVPFVVGVVLAGVGQGLSYLGAQELLDACAPQEGRGAIMSAFFLVLYVAGAISALAVGLGSVPLGLRAATGIVTAAVIALSAASAIFSFTWPRA